MFFFCSKFRCSWIIWVLRSRDWQTDCFTSPRTLQVSIHIDLKRSAWMTNSSRVHFITLEPRAGVSLTRAVFLCPSFSLSYSLSGPLINDMKQSACEKDLSCRKLKEQLDALERETSAKLSQMEQYNREIKVGFNSFPMYALKTFKVPCFH